MRVFRDGRYYKAARVTGPKHNFLGLMFAQPGLFPKVIMEALPSPTDQNDGIVLDKDEVCSIVSVGVEQANKELGTNLHIERIQYVPTDSPGAEAYILLARALVEAKMKDRSSISSNAETE